MFKRNNPVRPTTFEKEEMENIEQEYQEENGERLEEETEEERSPARPVPGLFPKKSSLPTAALQQTNPPAGKGKAMKEASDDNRAGLTTKIDRDLYARMKFEAYISSKRINQMIEEWIDLHCPELPKR